MNASDLHGAVADFVVDPSDLQKYRVIGRGQLETIAASLPPGQVIAEVERFAFTANSITYAVLGESGSYWRFFPTIEGWGIIPVWGTGRTVFSNHPEFPAGERFFGYVPMSTHMILQPERLGPPGFFDGTAQRANLDRAYNWYVRLPKAGAGRQEELRMLLHPLFMMSFLAEDFLEENEFFGASLVILSSASSKTAAGLAFLLDRDWKGKIAVAGLTSASNLAFVQSLGFYGRALAYENLPALARDRPAVYVDLAGNGRLREKVHDHLGAQLKCSCRVGFVHHRALDDDLDGRLEPRPVRLFAPDRIRYRSKQWGAKAFEARLSSKYNTFAEAFGDRIEITERRGLGAVANVYRNVLAGTAAPETGCLLSLID
jgi:Protein of unknown function (DUF2855)